ncbi:MAG TPA: metallophosphoesterase [Clostridiales bacterium UBA8960]|jgi:Icc-related predicted phosphoesterase|nr:metallophosphoesterase [Clostridiales bacterium UBA8960]
MRILAISDTESIFIRDHFNPDIFKGVDLILSAGDLKADYLSCIVTLINVPLLYVHGNHDARLLQEPPEGCICIDDKVIEYGGLRIAGLGGCMTYSGGPLQFTEQQMKRRIIKNTLKYRKGIDLLLTHSPAYKLGDGQDRAHVGYKCFVDLLDKHSPRLMIHGHQHLCYGNPNREINYKKTRIINAYEYVIIE